MGWCSATSRPRAARGGHRFFNLVLVFNKGAAFSFLAEAPGWQTPLFIGFALVAAVLVRRADRAQPRQAACSALGLALIWAARSATSSTACASATWSTSSISTSSSWHWPAFNVADSAITVGAVLLILEGFVHHEKRAGAPS